MRRATSDLIEYFSRDEERHRLYGNPRERCWRSRRARDLKRFRREMLDPRLLVVMLLIGDSMRGIEC